MSGLISVVVPVYNMGNSLDRCVASILSQENADFEVILVDDGSTDDSWERCQHLSQQDERVRAFHTENRGSGPARNHGIEQAQGRYVYFPDADDTLTPNALRCMLDSIQKNSADLLVFGYQVLDENGHARRIKTYPEFVQDGESIRQNYSNFAGLKTRYGIQGAPWNKLFDLDVIRQHDITYPPLRRHQDEAFIARYMCHASKVQFISDSLYTHYQNTLTLEWKKFPVDYADIVRELYKTRQDTILAWNAEDHKTHQIIHEELVDDLIKAFELSYSPKHDLTAAQRRQWVAKHVEESGICRFVIYSDYSQYKKVLLQLFRHKLYRSALTVIRLKVTADKFGMDWLSKKYR